MRLVKIKILDRLYNPDVLFIKITAGDNVKFERVDESTTRRYRATIAECVEAAALEYAEQIGFRAYGVTYE